MLAGWSMSAASTIGEWLVTRTCRGSLPPVAARIRSISVRTRAGWSPFSGSSTAIRAPGSPVRSSVESARMRSVPSERTRAGVRWPSVDSITTEIPSSSALTNTSRTPGTRLARSARTWAIATGLSTTAFASAAARLAPSAASIASPARSLGSRSLPTSRWMTRRARSSCATASAWGESGLDVRGGEERRFGDVLDDHVFLGQVGHARIVRRQVVVPVQGEEDVAVASERARLELGVALEPSIGARRDGSQRFAHDDQALPHRWDLLELDDDLVAEPRRCEPNVAGPAPHGRPEPEQLDRQLHRGERSGGGGDCGGLLLRASELFDDVPPAFAEGGGEIARGDPREQRERVQQVRLARPRWGRPGRRRAPGRGRSPGTT